ncbi:MAG: hypothetical protein JNM08_07390 [Rubrivivax sp.]|nr:hypothetical protein [Rubrivivax sp.]
MTPITRRAAMAALAPALLPGFARAADPLPAMVRLDALYIPALSLTSAAQTDAKAAPRAVQALERLRQAWPALRAALAATPPTAAAGADWNRALAAVARQIAQAEAAVAKAAWHDAHEALEPVRIELMKVRRSAGYDYFVDRLTAFHEPMEVLALAGSQLQPQGLDAPKRGELERAFAEASARWREVETHLPDPRRHGLSAAREAQFRQGVAAETQALARLSDALRGTDAAALLAAARAIKPPFARAFTAFGLAEGETLG